MVDLIVLAQSKKVVSALLASGVAGVAGQIALNYTHQQRIEIGHVLAM